MAAIPLTSQDINVIHSLDFKCYSIPLDVPDKKNKLLTWIELAQQDSTVVSTIASAEDKRVGFAVWSRGESGRPAYIIRLGVLPAYRRRGIGEKILGWVLDDLRLEGKSLVKMVLPHVVCLGPGDPDDVSTFLKKMQFDWVGLLPGEYHHYNRPEDGFIFERKL